MKRNLIFTFLILLSSCTVLQAIPAYPGLINRKQADGTEITIRIYGDEFSHFITTTDDYLLVENSNGLLVYADVDKSGHLSPSNIQAKNPEKRNYADEQSLKRFHQKESYIKTHKTKRDDTASKRQMAPSAMGQPMKFPLQGSPRSLVILVNFSNKSFVTPNPLDAFTSLLNEEGYAANGGTGSAKDYYRDSSHGQFDPIFDVVGPYTLPESMAYYGGNSGGNGNDQRPAYMVVDACRLAHEDGVDFSIYDTSGNGRVDNVFIYYAGHNEAEGGGANTIWPHRWVVQPNYNYNGSIASVTFDGKRVYDYACTSELRGSSGSNMAGIGTFCHEFGHVLGLPDYYDTQYSGHHTLSYWDIMDGGAYLNQGRTPPTFSAYSRFFLGWLEPELLETPENYVLDTLLTSNQAYLISSTESHNMNGANPSPREFFMLENRQNSGWDRYLPGQGMLVTHINYNSSIWGSNTVNNNPIAMGYDIIEADGIANNNTLSGDPFPGTANVTDFAPILRNGTQMDKEVNEITEEDGIISFKYRGGPYSADVYPIALQADEITPYSFTAHWEEVPYTKNYIIDVYTLENGVELYLDGFHLKELGDITSYTVSDLDAKTKYYYRVKANRDEVTTHYSNVIEVNTAAYTLSMFAPTAFDAEDITHASFIAGWDWTSDKISPNNYLLSVYKRIQGEELEYAHNGFQGGELPDGWTANNFEINTASGYYGAVIPSMLMSTNGDYLQTPLFSGEIKELSFWYRGRNTFGTSIDIFTSNNGNDWTLAHTISSVRMSATTINLDSNELGECKALRFVFNKSSGGATVSIDDIEVGFWEIVNEFVGEYNNLDVGSNTSYVVEDLESDTEYHYHVNAADGTDISERSNIIEFRTKINTSNKTVILPEGIKLTKTENGLILQAIDNNNRNSVDIFTSSGVKIHSSKFNNEVLLPLSEHGVYILQVNGKAVKLIW